VTVFSGRKFVTLANSSVLGGKNQIMGGIFITAGEDI